MKLLTSISLAVVFVSAAPASAVSMESEHASLAHMTVDAACVVVEQAEQPQLAHVEDGANGTALLQHKHRLGKLAAGVQCSDHGLQPYDWARVDSNYNSSGACSDDSDCFGNGECNACSRCDCNVGWRGPYCGMLDLLPADANEEKQGIPMNGQHPTWGGAAHFEADPNGGGTWYMLGAGKHIKTGNFNPKWYWQRDPSYKEAKFNAGEDPWLGNDPYDFEIGNADDPLPNGTKEVVPAKDLYEEKSWLSLYESNSDATGKYTEKVSKWFRAFRADLKKVKNGPLLMLSNAGGGFNIIASESGSIKGPWKDAKGNTLDQEWASFNGSFVPTDTQLLPPPVYKFIDNGHCVKGWASLTDASGASLHGKYATRYNPNDNYHECDEDELDAWNCHMADPALLVKDDGKVIIAYRGTRCKKKGGGVDHKERIGLLYADSWNGTYTMQSNPIFLDTDPRGPMDGGLEDLFMWLDQNGGVHMVVHSQAQDHAHGCAEGYDDGNNGNGCPHSEATFNHKKKRGATLFSQDGLTNWKLSNWELFPSEVFLSDNKTRFLLKQQRPSLIFDGNQNPTHLITGVDYLYDPCCDWYAYGSGWTLVQPISQCKAGQVMKQGTCTACTAAEVSPRCSKPTSKYGSCVCAECNDYYSGDQCEIEPPWVTTCGLIESRKKCGGGATGTKWFIKPDGSRTNWGIQECSQACADYATKQGGKNGCCMSFHTTLDVPLGNCRFETRAGIATGYRKTHAVACQRHRQGQSP